jgi:N-acetylneuraminic acid mutarotase
MAKAEAEEQIKRAIMGQLGPEPADQASDEWVQWFMAKAEAEEQIKRAKKKLGAEGGLMRTPSCPPLNLQEDRCTLYVCGGMSNENPTTEFLEYDTAAENPEFKRLAPLQRPRYVGVAVMIKHQIYVIGGAPHKYSPPKGKEVLAKLPADPHTTIESFDTTADNGAWTDFAEIPAAHGGVCWPGVVGDPKNDKIYIIGGMVAGDKGGPVSVFTSQVSILDTKTKQWSTGQPLSEKFGVFATACIGRTIYISGGTAGGDRIKSDLFAYDMDQNRWSKLAVMPAARMQHRMLAAGDKLYVFSGKTNGDNYCEDMCVYDPTNDEWSSYPGLTPPRLHVGAVLMGKHIYIAGGEEMAQGGQSARNVVNLVNKLDLNTSPPTWEPIKHMRKPSQSMMICCNCCQ